HTRSKRDWSSDVCSSDLDVGLAGHRVYHRHAVHAQVLEQRLVGIEAVEHAQVRLVGIAHLVLVLVGGDVELPAEADDRVGVDQTDRKSTRLNSSHVSISY